MDIGAFLERLDASTCSSSLYFIGFFVLGFAQGTIRRCSGIGSILFSFLFAANLAEPLGDFLGQLDQFPPEYGYMIGFLTVFVAGGVAFALVAQGFYKPQPLFEKARFVDEIIGGILGLVEAALILGLHRHPRLVLPDPGHPGRSRRAAVPARHLGRARRRQDRRRLPRRRSSRPSSSLFGVLRADNIEDDYPRR